MVKLTYREISIMLLNIIYIYNMIRWIEYSQVFKYSM